VDDDDDIQLERAARRKNAEQALRVASDLLQRARLAIDRGELTIEEFARSTAFQLQFPLEAVREFAAAQRASVVSAATDEEAASTERLDAEARQLQEQIAELLARARP
jgi:hypothetical protein